MKRTQILSLALLMVCGGLQAVDTKDQQPQRAPAESPSTMHQPAPKGWFGRYDKSEAFSRDRYQTGLLSSTRLWLALKLISWRNGYTVNREGLNKALKIAACNDDAEKVIMLVNHRADPTVGLEAAINNRSLKTTQFLLSKGAQVQPRHLKALENCFSSCFQNNPQEVEKHLKTYACCKNMAEHVEKQLAKSNSLLTIQERDARRVQEFYARRAQHLSEQVATLEKLQEENKKNQERLHLVNDGLEDRLADFFKTVEETSRRDQTSWWQKLFPRDASKK